MRFERLAVIGIALGLAACDSVEDDRDSDPVSFRCLPAAGVGMVGLDGVTVMGTPTVSGPYGSLFSNELVTLGGAYDLEGDAISGGAVDIKNDSNSPGGSVIENAQKISVADPTDEVLRAKDDNDNDSVCVKKGNKCDPVISNYELTLNGQQQLTLKTGVYYLESVRINGQARVNIDGNVVIYLNGPATFNGGSSTNPDEDSLTIISSAPDELKLNGGAQSAMHILAPFATVKMTGTQGFRGTALGKHLNVSGTADIEATASLADVFGIECQPDETPEDSRPTPDGVPPT
jgi:hypothetical protein